MNRLLLFAAMMAVSFAALGQATTNTVIVDNFDSGPISLNINAVEASVGTTSKIGTSVTDAGTERDMTLTFVGTGSTDPASDCAGTVGFGQYALSSSVLTKCNLLLTYDGIGQNFDGATCSGGDGLDMDVSGAEFVFATQISGDLNGKLAMVAVDKNCNQHEVEFETRNNVDGAPIEYRFPVSDYVAAGVDVANLYAVQLGIKGAEDLDITIDKFQTEIPDPYALTCTNQVASNGTGTIPTRKTTSFNLEGAEACVSFTFREAAACTNDGAIDIIAPPNGCNATHIAGMIWDINCPGLALGDTGFTYDLLVTGDTSCTMKAITARCNDSDKDVEWHNQGGECEAEIENHLITPPPVPAISALGIGILGLGLLVVGSLRRKS